MAEKEAHSQEVRIMMEKM